MLETNQMSDLASAKRDVKDKEMILNIAVDIQVLLRILVDKEIISRDEVNGYRKEVKDSPKYKNSFIYIEQTLAEIEKYERDPQALLREMMRRKLQE